MNARKEFGGMMNIQRISLGVEELSLAYGLVGKPEMGKTVLASTYQELTEVQADTLLTGASHSLLARGICSINQDGSVHLDENIERALYPVVQYDHLVTFSMESKDTPTVQSQLFVSSKLGFTSHFVRVAVVHVIEHGTLNELPEYIADTFSALLPKAFVYDGDVLEREIDLASLGKGINAVREGRSPVDVFQAAGWDEETSKQIAQDLNNQILRGSVFRLNASSQVSDEERRQASKPTMLFLLGVSRVWTFDFASAQDNERGIAQVCSWDAFIKKLQDFVL